MTKFFTTEDFIKHYGTPRHSGRYPWGSGENPYQRTPDFLSKVSYYEKLGYKDKQIMEFLKMTPGQFKTAKSLAIADRRRIMVNKAYSLREDGLNPTEIGRELGVRESTVRYWFSEASQANLKKAQNTADIIRERILSTESGVVDVGKNANKYLNVSKEKMEQALAILSEEGYEVRLAKMEQITNPNNFTTIKIICKKDAPKNQAYKFGEVNSIEDFTSDDGGVTFRKTEYPKSMDSNRVMIRYKDDGGDLKDGLIEIRRNVDDLSLGKSIYSQVRILVDDKKYMKGMAVYSDDLPTGIDIIYNTNKTSDVPKDKVFKDISTVDPNNPFGSYIKANGQSKYIDKNGKEQLSLINKRADEGDWDDWSNKLAAQFLSKQNKQLIDRQLKMTIDDVKDQYNDILNIENKTVRKKMLNDFALECDANAVSLKTMALPKQKYQVILPLTTVKDNEVYAPNFNNGEKVALVRFPHAGPFEIPILTVNNKNKEGKGMMSSSPIDAIGINKNVAERLSGADFDGDTVLVIPTKHSNVTSRPPLADLKNYDPKDKYSPHEVRINKKGKEEYYQNGIKYKTIESDMTKGREMGMITNLITDMYMKGASDEELARATKHSMTVIDAQKHHLNYKQSAIDNGIEALKKIYQKHTDDDGYGGASTLLSRAKREATVPRSQGSKRIDPETGEVYTIESPLTYVDKKGNVKQRTMKTTEMALTKDARSLSSGTWQEEAYANYANVLKKLANEARKTMVNTKGGEYSPTANKIYKKEVDALLAQLNLAERNAPRERKAQYLAYAKLTELVAQDPDLKSKKNKKLYKKLKDQILIEARNKVGAKRHEIKLTDRFWEAIQAGALSDTKVRQIINYVDKESLWKYSSNYNKTGLTKALQDRIDRLLRLDFSANEIASQLKIPQNAVLSYIKEERK